MAVYHKRSITAGLEQGNILRVCVCWMCIQAALHTDTSMHSSGELANSAAARGAAPSTSGVYSSSPPCGFAGVLTHLSVHSDYRGV